jgi:tRNA U34 5-methylaminomethyl-2-thiouridine-forming methyltransferase MnmC
MIEIIITKDGSHTLRNHFLDETYHSRHGARMESLHVFIKHGLEQVLESNAPEISLLEVGFGTGLNAWLTAKRVLGAPVQLHYVALESYPVDESVWSKLNYAATSADRELFQALHRVSWNTPVPVTANLTITKIHSMLQQVNFPTSAFDLIFYDAFAPNKQPEMWTSDILEKTATWLKPGGTWVTYCAKGQVKRDLKSAGLTVETLPGPPGKREMIRAIKHEIHS